MSLSIGDKIYFSSFSLAETLGTETYDEFGFYSHEKIRQIAVIKLQRHSRFKPVFDVVIVDTNQAEYSYRMFATDIESIIIKFSGVKVFKE
jgi:hypothetical protein